MLLYSCKAKEEGSVSDGTTEAKFKISRLDLSNNGLLHKGP